MMTNRDVVFRGMFPGDVDRAEIRAAVEALREVISRDGVDDWRSAAEAARWIADAADWQAREASNPTVPESAPLYAGAPALDMERAALARLAEEVRGTRPLPRLRELALRKAAWLDRAALATNATAVCHQAEECARELVAMDRAFGTAAGPVPERSAEWETELRAYVHREHAAWLEGVTRFPHLALTCPACASTEVARDVDADRPWVLVSVCSACGKRWMESADASAVEADRATAGVDSPRDPEELRERIADEWAASEESETGSGRRSL